MSYISGQSKPVKPFIESFGIDSDNIRSFELKIVPDKPVVITITRFLNTADMENATEFVKENYLIAEKQKDNTDED